MLAILPKFYSLGNDAEAGPMRWAGNLLPLEPRLHLFEACLERMAVVERAGLVRCPGAKLRIPAASCEIGVPFLLTDFFHRTFNAYLPPQRFPVEQKGGMGIGEQIGGLASRSEERRVGKEGVRRVKSRGW